MGRLRKWLAPLVEDLAKAIVAEQRRQNPPRILLDQPPLSDAERDVLREQYSRNFGGTIGFSYRGQPPTADVRIGR